MNKAVEKLKQSIERLPERERKRLVRWLLKKDAEEWDQQLSSDAAAGKLQFLTDEAESERKARRLIKFPE
jgi:hypothetical protein